MPLVSPWSGWSFVLDLRNALSALAMLLAVACGGSTFYPARPLDATRISQHWTTSNDDMETLEEIAKIFEDRFAGADEASPPFLTSLGGKLETAPDGTTQGLAEIAISPVELMPPPKPVRLHSAVKELSAEGQRALLSPGREKRTKDEFETLLKRITLEEEPSLVNPVRPKYGFVIDSDIFSGGLWDRFEEIDTLLVVDGAKSEGVRIHSFELVANSELEVRYGQITRADATKTSLAGNVAAPLPVTGATAGVSATYERTWSETLTRDLAEKIVTTSSYRQPASVGQNRRDLSSRALWVVQRGHRNHKLRHSLAQVVTLDIDRATEGVATKDLWEIVAEKSLRHTSQTMPTETFELWIHAASLGVVRQLRSEDARSIFNEEHTVEEGDDVTDKHVVTRYQHLRLPVQKRDVYRVVMHDAAGSEVSLVVREPDGPRSHDALFLSEKDARQFLTALYSATWRNPTSQFKNAHAKILGATVEAEGLRTASAAEAADETLHILVDE